MERRMVAHPALTPLSRYALGWRLSAGTLVILSGIVPTNASGKTVAGDMTNQARQAFENIGFALQSAGATFADLVQLRVYLTHIERDLSAYRTVRDTLLGEALPTSTIVEVNRLASSDWLIEVEAMAFVAG